MPVMLQGGEIIIILLVALVVLGPERLPQLARKLGAWSTELRKAASELRAGLEAEVGDIKQIRDDIKGPLDEVKGEMRDVGRQLDEASSDVRRLGWVGPDPVSGPTAKDAMKDLDEIEARQKPAEPVPPEKETGTPEAGEEAAQ